VQFVKTAPIVVGDTLETGADGFLEVAMPDYSYISMSSNTSLEVVELDRVKKQSLYNFIRREVTLGKLYIEHKCYLRGQGECWVTRYRISRGATLAVRGTEFNMEQDEDGSTTLYLFEGIIEVSVTNLDKPVTLKAMEQLVIRQDGSIDGPTPLDAESVPHWWETGP
jgi:hypothetical protein